MTIHLFTCKKCGGHDLTVTHTYDIIVDGICRETWEEWGLLDDDHHWSYEESEKIEEIDEEGGEESEGREVDEESHEFYVSCSGCDQEIEFGWSHPDRAGRIWPAECGDFNPWKCWPEPRYRESWEAKGWLRPESG